MTRLAHHDLTAPDTARAAIAPKLPALPALARHEDPHLEGALYEDARAFLSRPGKAFRARLIEACFALAGGPPAGVPRAALEAIELLHGGSLIVDDIQDDAELRRGAPALHRIIGTPRALNTGNWLYFVALARLDELPFGAEAARALTRAAHHCLVRCHEGQALDLTLRVDDLRRGELAALAHTISASKTGALTSFAAALGARLAQAAPEVVAQIASFGQHVGLALQMLDDLGALTCEGRRHKALEDLRGHRVSWPWAWAAEVLDEVTFKQLVRQLGRDAELEALRARLADAVEPVGRARVRRVLSDAKRELASIAAPEAACGALWDELTRLENAYG